MSKEDTKAGSAKITDQSTDQQNNEKPNEFKQTLKTLITYLAGYQVKIIVVLIFSVGSTVFAIAGPKLLGKITTKLFDGIIAYYLNTGLLTDFKYIFNLVVWMIILYTISAVLSYSQGYIMAGVATDVAYKLREDISKKINRLPLKYFDQSTHGEVLSRITNDVDTVSQTLNQSLSQIITSAVMTTGILGMMLSINIMMTFVAVIIIPLSLVAVIGIVKKSQIFFKQQQQYLGKINSHVEEMYGGCHVVQAFNGEQDSIDIFEVINKELYSTAWKSQFWSTLMNPIMNFVGNLGYVVVCILGGYLAVKGTVKIGDIQAFIQYMRSFNQPIQQLSTISTTLQSTVAAAERVFEFLEEEEEVLESEATADMSKVFGAVEFNQVYFGYDSKQMIIKNFSINIKPGQKVAIVGPTGAGKTTIVKLLMRFYEINSGDIFVDGYAINSITRKSLRQMFGMVLQETWLYNASIMENIRYGSFNKTDEEVIEAAKAAHCDEFIRVLPNGYQMILNEDASNISQGQKQLLTIARVFLADPKILILDEATSSVDTRTEVLIQQAMERLMGNKTSFVIAHRLSTIRNSDMILVMKDGDIIEHGNHTDLIARKGFYAGLYNSQFIEGEEQDDRKTN